ncbi:histidine kinase [Micromonospora polyrhachis]|uniref:Two-component system LytT family sensor kinase n=1 Tax=Micromonospora polyrhachis TaxID=1282883 RepID=A0A7W7SQC6_9ACTN|nr:histidine kinase [Micromonospora polyrhachis]MBB4959003.1 two-component system LytT family sensor kinase [Micromonospora polyrhachis]
MDSNLFAAFAVVALVSALGAALFAVVRLRGRRGIATATQRATYEVLHTAGLAAEPLRAGLTPAGAAKAVRHLRALVGAAGLALVDAAEVLAIDGRGSHHGEQLVLAAQRAIAADRSTVLGDAELPCDRVDCPVRGAVVAPLTGPGGRAAGALVAIADGQPAPGLVQATLETADWAGAQLALAELDSSRERLARAEVRALRAQISPHFIYNALTAIGSFVRTDPERARELILEFAEFTRYSFRAHGEFTTLAEELRSIDRYLTIERARFGDRLQVRLQIAPEVLPVSVPFLCLQPLVENAVQHGLSRKPGTGMVSIEARDAGTECHITVEDDGVGMDPELLTTGIVELAATDPSDDTGQHVGLSNVDERLRSVFGDQFGLVVETGLGSGTKVSMRVPKFHRHVRANP